MFNNQHYDFIIDDGNELLKVQVKTSSRTTRLGIGREVRLATGGGNTKVNISRLRDVDDYDLLFILTDNDRVWLILSNKIRGNSTITVGNERSAYCAFELNVKNKGD